MSTLRDILHGTDPGEVGQRTSGVRESPFAGIGQVRGRRDAPAPALTSVRATLEFRRVEALPRRVLDFNDVQDVTDLFRRPGGTMRLRPIQSAALLEAAMMDGGLFPIGVGLGKTLLTLLLPTALDSKNAVLLVPPQLKRQLAREIETVYGKHFRLPLDVLTIIAYSELSSAKTADILDQINPDLIIADECHFLKRRTAARSKRFARFLKENPGTRFVGLSGTITTRSLNDFGHLLEFALKKCSPLPRGYQEVQEWAGALDVKPEIPTKSGALKKFCAEGENVRQGFRRRLVESQGVVASSEDDVGSSLVIKRLKLPLPAKIQTLYNEVKKSWSIDGEEFSEAIRRAAVLKQIACGFYYRWAWPGEKDWEWLTARANWNKAVREKLKQSRAGLDSPLLLANAAERSLLDKGNGPRWDQGAQVWAEWKEVKDRPEPPTETIWVDEFMLRDLEKRARELAKDAPVIVWAEHVALGERLAEETGWPFFGEGSDASPSRDLIIVATVTTQGTGKNLQYHFVHNIFSSLPPNGAIFQQTVARTHRLGQLADEVTVAWYGHTLETEQTMEAVRADAIYQQELTGPQKVLYATHINEGE